MAHLCVAPHLCARPFPAIRRGMAGSADLQARAVSTDGVAHAGEHFHTSSVQRALPQGAAHLGRSRPSTARRQWAVAQRFAPWPGHRRVRHGGALQLVRDQRTRGSHGKQDLALVPHDAMVSCRRGRGRAEDAVGAHVLRVEPRGARAAFLRPQLSDADAPSCECLYLVSEHLLARARAARPTAAPGADHWLRDADAHARASRRGVPRRLRRVRVGRRAALLHRAQDAAAGECSGCAATRLGERAAWHQTVDGRGARRAAPPLICVACG
mmetsp:Transcript_22749/g.52429  ORF Transcript_22749/g.52429 Transcript_22749/m.52429 type:complete len:269 (+) Transcript_22749:305-1111(+)